MPVSAAQKRAPLAPLTWPNPAATITPGSEVWCSGLTRCPVKAETAGSNPVTSASVNFWCPNLTVQGEETSKIGSRLHRRDPIVVNNDLLEDQFGESITLLVCSVLPRAFHLRKQSGKFREALALAQLPGYLSRKLALETVALDLVLPEFDVAELIEDLVILELPLETAELDRGLDIRLFRFIDNEEAQAFAIVLGDDEFREIGSELFLIAVEEGGFIRASPLLQTFGAEEARPARVILDAQLSAAVTTNGEPR